MSCDSLSPCKPEQAGRQVGSGTGQRGALARATSQSQVARDSIADLLADHELRLFDVALSSRLTARCFLPTIGCEMSDSRQVAELISGLLGAGGIGLRSRAASRTVLSLKD